MKKLLLLPLLLCGCAAPHVTPMPDVKPVQAAHVLIGNSLHKIGTDVTAAQGITHSISANLKLKMNEKELAAVKAGAAELAKRLEAVQLELQVANNALRLAQNATVVIQHAVEAEHAQLVTCVAQNESMRVIVKEVNSYWGLGAILYGIKRLFTHLLVFALVLIVAGVLLTIFCPPVKAFFIMAGPLARDGITFVWSKLTSIIKRK